MTCLDLSCNQIKNVLQQYLYIWKPDMKQRINEIRKNYDIKKINYYFIIKKKLKFY
jgi:hypothetical protein